MTHLAAHPRSPLARLLWPALAATLLAGCSSDGLDTFRVTETATATIPAGTVVETFAGDLPFGSDFLNFDITENQEFKNQGVKISQIDSVTLTKLKLTVTSPDDGDLTFLNSLVFNVESDGLPTVEVASGGPFDAGVKVVNMNLTGAELRPYVAAAKMALTTAANGKRPKKETVISAEVELRIDVNVSGLLK